MPFKVSFLGGYKVPNKANIIIWIEITLVSSKNPQMNEVNDIMNRVADIAALSHLNDSNVQEAAWGCLFCCSNE